MKFFKHLRDLRKMNKKASEELNLKKLLKIYRVFGQHYKKYWKIIAASFLSLFATIGVTVLTPWPLKIILDHLILNKELPEFAAFLRPVVENSPRIVLLSLAISIVLLSFLQAIFSYFNKFWLSKTGDSIGADIRERVFAHLNTLSLSFHEGSRTGKMIYLLTSDIGKMKAVLVNFPQDVMHRVGLFSTYIVLMALLNWKLCLISLATFPFFFLFTRFFGAGMKKFTKKSRKQESEVASILSENLQAMSLVQAYGREDTECERFTVENKASLKSKLSTLKLYRTFSRILDVLVGLGIASILYFGGKFALGGEILPGTLVIFVTYLQDMFGTVHNFNEIFLSLAKSQASAERLMEVLDEESTVKDRSDAIQIEKLNGKIEFKNVSFSYKKGKKVLNNLSFEVQPGENIALVGHSGAGKSTLISLLLRFYDPQEGQIFIDGEDVRKYTMKSLRNQTTILFQEARLFQMTVKENIAFGKKGATEEEVIRAAKLAEAHNFIMRMPKGYNTMMYEGGENLSGGQKQRINIARAIIRDKPIVILDEPSTGLDAKSEMLVHKAIEHLTKNRTTFIIAHKFSTIANADRILLLDEGQIAHIGTHKQLMENSKEYRELYELQFGKIQPLALQD